VRRERSAAFSTEPFARSHLRGQGPQLHETDDQDHGVIGAFLVDHIQQQVG
jgi:hypothetical protein